MIQSMMICCLWFILWRNVNPRKDTSSINHMNYLELIKQLWDYFKHSICQHFFVFLEQCQVFSSTKHEKAISVINIRIMNKKIFFRMCTHVTKLLRYWNINNSGWQWNSIPFALTLYSSMLSEDSDWFNKQIYLSFLNYSTRHIIWCSCSFPKLRYRCSCCWLCWMGTWLCSFEVAHSSLIT